MILTRLLFDCTKDCNFTTYYIDWDDYDQTDWDDIRNNYVEFAGFPELWEDVTDISILEDALRIWQHNHNIEVIESTLLDYDAPYIEFRKVIKYDASFYTYITQQDVNDEEYSCENLKEDVKPVYSQTNIITTYDKKKVRRSSK